MPKDNQRHFFNTIHHYLSPTKAITLSGHMVTRQERLFMPELGHYVVCCPYDNHFLYRNPINQKGSTLLCTCGDYGIIVGYNAYKGDASPTSGTGIVPGEMLVCNSHSHYGKHADGTR